MSTRLFVPAGLPPQCRVRPLFAFAAAWFALAFAPALAVGQPLDEYGAVPGMEPPVIYRLPPVDEVFSPQRMPGGANPFWADESIERLPLTTLEADASGAVVSAEAVAGMEPSIEVEPDSKPPKLWSSSIEFGINGSEGNSQVFDFRLGAELKRQTKYHTLSAELRYKRSHQDNELTADRLFYEGTSERHFEDSPWTTYIHSTLEYDEFKAFDSRVTADAGLGYHLWKTDLTTLTSRLGAGFSREVGGPDVTVVPELNYSLSLEHQLSKRQRIALKGTYIPGLDGDTRYRINSAASWIVNLDDEMHLNLKFSVADRYDNTPNGAVANDLDYSAVLLWEY